MSALRSVALPAALLAATGGVALATWRYLSARRQKGEAVRVEEGGEVQAVSAQEGEEPDPFTAGEQHEGAKKQNEGCRSGSQGSDKNARPGGSPVHQEEKHTAAAAMSIPDEKKRAAATSIPDEEKKRAAAAATSVPDEKKRAAATSIPDEEKKRAAAAATSIPDEEKKRAAAAATSIPDEKKRAAATSIPDEEKKRAAAAATSIPDEEKKRAAAAATSIPDEKKRAAATSIPDEEKKRAAAAATSIPDEEKKRAAAAATSIPDEEKKRAAAAVTSIPDEEKRAAAVVTSMTIEKKRAAAAVTSILHGEEKSANPDSAASQDESSVLYEKYHHLENSTSEEQYNTSSVQTKEDTSKSPKSSVDPRVEKGIIDTVSSVEIQLKEKHAPCKQVVVLGLDGSGKTSILNSIAANKGRLITTPTEGVNALCVCTGNSKMEFLEIGGSEQLRPYWKMYLSRAFAVIFVVDSADHGRLPLAKRHLHQLIQLDSVLPLIVLANKQDLQGAYHIPEIHDALALSEICENRKLFLIGTYVTKDGSETSGIQDTKEFLSQLLLENSAKIK